MNSLDTLYFPTTALWSLRQYPLFLVLPRIHILTPFESSDTPETEEETNSFIYSGLCQAHTPCPLGADLSRFKYLLRDIKIRKDDYVAQLSSLALAAHTSQKISGENSEQEIISSVIVPAEIKAKDDREKHLELLWRVRMILAIGDLLDQEHEEVAFHMNLLENDERNLFKELQGDDEDFADEEGLFTGLADLRGKLNSHNPGLVRNRFKAWKMLYSNATELPQSYSLATDRDCGDLLMESYEKITGDSAIELASLFLPAFIGHDDQSAVDTVRDFRKQNKDLLADLSAMLAAQTSETAADSKKVQDLAALVNEKTGQYFPEEKYGRRTLSIYSFPAIGAVDLIMGTKAGQSASTNVLAFFFE